MLNVFICEDNAKHRNEIQKCVSDCIMIYDLDIKIALSTGDPEAVVTAVSEKSLAGLYFLDVNLNHEIDGIALAKIIRKYDPRGFIVFITTHDEALPVTFKYMLEAMDFVLKEEFASIKDRIYSCILNAWEKYTSKPNDLQKNYSFSVFDKVITVPLFDIVYFATSVNNKHKILLNTLNAVYEFRSSLSELSSTLDSSFYRCHHAFIINLQHVSYFDTNTQTIFFKKGGSCLVSDRKKKELILLLKNIDKKGGSH